MRGLLHQLGPRVSLAPPAAADAPPLAGTCVFDKSFAYFRPAAVSSNLPEAFQAAYQRLCQTNADKIKGVVLDLRFAGAGLRRRRQNG